MTRGTPIPEERLLELLLDGAPDGREDRRLERLREDPETAARLDELEGFLAECRDVHAAPEAEADPCTDHLVRRVLADTTRSDPSWRGDLRLVGSFVAERVRESRALQVVAASLALHVVAVPVAAWVILSEPAPEPHLNVRIEPPPPEEIAEEPVEPDLDPAGNLEPEVLAAENAENLLRRHAYLLAHGALPSVPHGALPGDLAASPRAPLEIRLLAARSGADGGVQDAEVLADGSGLALALLAESQLDRYARERVRPARLAAVLGRLRAESPGYGPAVRALAHHALDRAAAYGVAEPRPDAGPAPATTPPVSGPLAHPAGDDWIARLGDALDEAGLAAHPVADAWLER